MAAAKKPAVTPQEDHRLRLERLRDQLEAALQVCSENMLPQLSGQYRSTLADLAALPAADTGPLSVRDQLKERRESKRSTHRSPAPKASPTPKASGS